VQAVESGIRQAGRRPVLLAGTRLALIRYGSPARQIMKLRSTQDTHTLTTPPKTTDELKFNVWMSEP